MYDKFEVKEIIKLIPNVKTDIGTEELRRELKNRIKTKSFNVKGYIDNIATEFRYLRSSKSKLKREVKYSYFITYVYLICEFEMESVKSFFGLDKKNIIKVLKYVIVNMENEKFKENLLEFFSETTKRMKKYKSSSKIPDETMRKFYTKNIDFNVKRTTKPPSIIQLFETTTGIRL